MACTNTVTTSRMAVRLHTAIGVGLRTLSCSICAQRYSSIRRGRSSRNSRRLNVGVGVDDAVRLPHRLSAIQANPTGISANGDSGQKPCKIRHGHSRLRAIILPGKARNTAIFAAEIKNIYLYKVVGGWGGIRTHGGLAPSPVFKTGALNRSATHPTLCGASYSRTVATVERSGAGAEAGGGAAERGVIGENELGRNRGVIGTHPSLGLEAAAEFAFQQQVPEPR